MNDPAINAMLAMIDSWYKDNIWPNPPPAGMQLQMHPLVFNRIRQAVDYRFLSSSEDWRSRFPVPVKVNHELTQGTWRLVTVTEAVHVGGELPHE